MSPKTRTRILFAVAAAVLLLVGLTSAVVIGGGDGSPPREAVTAASDGAHVDGGGGAETTEGESSSPPASDDSTTEGSGEVGTAGSAASGDGPAPDGARSSTAAPRAGTYVYEWSRRAAEEESGTYEVAVIDAGESDGGYRQSIRSGITTEEVVWRRDGMHVLATIFGSGDEAVECNWQPDYRKLATPLKAGATWSYAATCTMTAGESTSTVEQSGDFTVVERTRVDVAGESVDVWKIEGVEETVSPKYGQRQTTTAYFSPAHGLMVKTTTATAATAPWVSNAAVTETEIKNLSPQ